VALKAFPPPGLGFASRSPEMLKLPELESDSGHDVWSAITAAEAGNAKTLRRLLSRDLL
jgi:hypothetical protein